MRKIFGVTAMIVACFYAHAEDVPRGIRVLGQEWQIAQWHSRGKLEEVTEDGFADAFKSVKVDKRMGAVTLCADTSADYERPRRKGEPWVHLLLEQGKFAQAVRVAEAGEIWVEVEFELTHLREFVNPEEETQAAQFSWFLYLKNTREESPGRHDFVWFGLSLFDSRHDFTTLYAARDFAVPEGKFIYQAGSESFLNEKVTPGKRVTVRRDILPDIRAAIDAAHAQGFILHSNFEDMTLDGMNIGWEIPGMFDAGMTIHRLRVEVK